MAESFYHRSIAALKNPNDVVLSVCNEQVLLFGITGKGKRGYSTMAQSIGSHEEFLHKLALYCEYLNPVVLAVSDVQQPIVREPQAD